MNKRLLLSASGIVFAIAAGQAQAERKYGLAGCGLGSVFFGPKSGASTQSIAAYTNYFAYNQMFGISFGTSNCTPSGKGSADDERAQEGFFVSNFQTLSKEIAQGEGETLVAFADALGCEAAVTPAVVNGLRDGYDAIFAQPGAVAAFDVARDTLRADPDLSARCAKL